MPISRSKKRDPVGANGAVKQPSLKRKRELENDEKALPVKRIPKNTSSRSTAIYSESADNEAHPLKNTPERLSEETVQVKDEVKATAKKVVRVRNAEINAESADEPGTAEIIAKHRTVKTRKKTIAIKDEAEPEHESDCGSVKDEETSPKKRKRKTKEEKEADAMPLAARTTGLRMFVGAHTSIAKGLENSVKNCVHIGGNAFALFLKSQRKWENPPLKDESRDAFLKACVEEKYDAGSHVLPHGSYLVNLAQKDNEKAKQAYDVFVDDLHRCEALGIRYYNFHPGASGGEPLEEFQPSSIVHWRRPKRSLRC